MNFNLSKKNSQDKWWTWGSFKKNKWENYQASFKATKEFKEMIANLKDDEWINFSGFENDGKFEKKTQEPAPVENVESDDFADLPF